jgi:hypothetical protein
VGAGPTVSKKNAQWAFVFEILGKENLRKMLFKAAVEKDESGRVVIEFQGDNALNITEHVEKLEEEQR